MTGDLNLGTLVRAVAERVPQRVAVRQGERVLTYAELVDRSTRLARYLNDRGIGHFADRSQLRGHESGQHLLAQYLHNAPQFIEGLVGCYLGRVAPFNVNYRYTADELRYLLRDAAPTVIQYHAAFAPVLAEVLPDLPGAQILLQVADGSGNPLLRGAVDYEEALASATPEVHQDLSPDDLYVIYTGGTTGMPKGVLWRQGDAAVATLGLRDKRGDREWTDIRAALTAIRADPARVLPCAPMMHGAAQWAALGAVCEGNTVVFPEHAQRFTAADGLAAVASHRVTVITLVGDAFGWPLVEELQRGNYDVSSLRVIVSGGAALHASCKQRLVELIPGVRVVENIGSSESGIVGSHVSADAVSAAEVTFTPDDSMFVVAEDLSHFLEAGHDGVGWLARGGRIPLGYLGDADKTARTFPVVEGMRVTISGDRARLLADGQVQLLGRDALTINTGGEKVFVEEVEAVLKDHPDVADALVCGRPSERWGSEVAAVVVAPSGIDEPAVLDFCRSRLARYKIPRVLHVVPRIVRSDTGKPDYEWAVQIVSELGAPAPQDSPPESAATGTLKEGSCS
ncbi:MULTISPECIES: AMP-binding protein [unclassified Mycobacterium]|uniref:AMP-binding protein n=1 Tax=unclassified Mycobacterium TaxID=2642494 RepID=UPI0009E67014|nr:MULTISPECIES: AMP-binding protein [unclassified Mycobacterium]